MRQYLGPSLLALSLFVLFSFSLVAAYTETADGFYLNTGESSVAIDKHGVCKIVSNGGSAPLFVPTSLALEWSGPNGFTQGAPAGTTVADCCTSNSYQQCNSGNVWWYDSCNNPESVSQTCSGSYCSGSTVYTYTGCSGSSCTSTATQSCSGSYCSGDNRYSYTGCSGGSCTSAFQETCDSGSYYCSGDNVRVTNGCSGGGCDTNFVESCDSSGYYCSGSQRRYAGGCSGGSCVDNFVENCANGCSGGACITCTPNSYQQCSGGALYNYDSCGVQGSQASSCSGSFCSDGNTAAWYTGCSGSSCTYSYANCDDILFTALPYCSGDTLVTDGYCSGGSCYQSTTSCATNNVCVGSTAYAQGCYGSPGSAYCGTSTSGVPCATSNYCSSNRRYAGNGCSGGYCQEPLIEDCSSNGDICWGGNIYHAPWTCSPGQCNYDHVTYCSGTYCSGGNVWSYTGCSGSSCTSSMTQDCAGAGCSNGACNTYTYSWQTDAWSGCTGTGCGFFAECGGTSGEDYWEFRNVWCQRSDGQTVADSYCGGGKPNYQQFCYVICFWEALCD